MIVEVQKISCCKSLTQTRIFLSLKQEEANEDLGPILFPALLFQSIVLSPVSCLLCLLRVALLSPTTEFSEYQNNVKEGNTRDDVDDDEDERT